MATFQLRLYFLHLLEWCNPWPEALQSTLLTLTIKQNIFMGSSPKQMSGTSDVH